MRPTLLNFRSPKEVTPDFYNVRVTHQGSAMGFRVKSINRKTSMPQEQRSVHKHQSTISGSGVSAFLGPGTYNDHSEYLKLTQLPCSVKMRDISAVPKSESGKGCYIMVGNNLVYDYSQVSNIKEKQDLSKANASQCMVSLSAGVSKRSLSAIKERPSATQMTNKDGTGKASEDRSTRSFLQNYKSPHHTSSVDNKRYTTTSISNNNRPQTTIINNNAQSQVNIDDSSMTAYQRPQTSYNIDRKLNKLSQDQLVQQRQGSIQEMNDGGGDNTNKSASVSLSNYNAKRIQDLRKQAKQKGMLPKTAANFINLKRGLFNRTTIKHDNFVKSINIIQAYNVPMNDSQIKQVSRGLSSGGSRPKYRKRSHYSRIDNMSNNNYINVIRDSPTTLYQKEMLEKQKQLIMNGNYATTNKSTTVHSSLRSGTILQDPISYRMNQFMQERASTTQDNEDQQQHHSTVQIQKGAAEEVQPDIQQQLQMTQ